MTMALSPNNNNNNDAHTTTTTTKIRILLACVSSIIVLISSVYNLTATFTRNIIIHHEIALLEEESRQLEIASNHVHAFQQEGNYSHDTTDGTLSPYKEGTKQKVYHTAAERKFDKRDVKQNEIQSWNDIEKALSTTDSKHLDADAMAASADQANETVKTKSPPGPGPRKPTDKPRERKIKPSSSPSSDTTIVITTNWMPSVPSTVQLDKVINSLVYLRGLPKDAPMVIAVDGAYEDGARYQSVRNVDMRKYIQAIQAKYSNNNNHNNVQIITSDKKIMLVRNMKRALQKVHTKYVLVLQHDLPFINEVNHTGLIETMETHSQVRLVRFPTARVLTRKRDGGICKEKEVDFESKNNNDIKLTKTHVWSDRNHLTRKSYYDEMFQLPGWNGVRTMEFHMRHYGTNNCSYWGSYLYGARGSNPTIFHMDGRRDGQFMTSTKRIYGNLTGLL